MAKQLKELLTAFIPKTDSWKLFLLQEWNTIVGDLTVQIRLEKIQKDTLILSVSNASWMQELHCLSDILIKKINSQLEQPYVKKLRFKCSDRTHKQKRTVSTNNPFNYDLDIKLTPKQTNALEKIVDKDLREALKKFYFRCYTTNHH